MATCADFEKCLKNAGHSDYIPPSRIGDGIIKTTPPVSLTCRQKTILHDRNSNVRSSLARASLTVSASTKIPKVEDEALGVL